MENTINPAPPKRNKHSLGRLFGYHGCEKSIAEKVLSGKTSLRESKNSYDWLGNGIYFWVDSPERAYNWAKNSKSIKEPAVIGALIAPGLCLNLTDYGVMAEIRDAYDFLQATAETAQTPLPINSSKDQGILLRRELDCAVINTIHALRRKLNMPMYDSVYGTFEEGGELYPGSGFRERTHTQIAVRSSDSILAYFRVSTKTFQL